MSFLTLLAYLVCTIIRPQDWVYAMFAWPMVQVLSAMTGLFLMVEYMGSRQSFNLRVPQSGLMIAMFVAVMMSHISNTYFFGMTEALDDFKILFILFFLMLFGVNSVWKIKGFYLFFVLLVIALVFQSKFQLQHGYGWAGQLATEDHLSDGLRANWIGIFNDPNDLALLFVMAVGMVLPWVFSKNNFIFRAIAFGGLALMIYGIILTNSRGGYLALTVTFYFFFVRLTRKFMIGSIIGAIMAGVILLFGPSRMGMVNVEEASANARVNLWYEGLQLIKRRPIFGVGYDMYLEDLSQTAHNSYVLVAAELGFFGLFIWMALIYTSLMGLTKVQRLNDQLRNAALGMQSALVGFGSAAFFLSRSYVILPYMIFALSGAIMALAKQQDSNLNFDMTAKDTRNVGLLSVGVLALIYVVIRFG